MRKVVHFFSAWGAGDAVVLLVTTLGSIGFSGGGGKHEWLTVIVGLCAAIVYICVAQLSRPHDDEGEKNESGNAQAD